MAKAGQGLQAADALLQALSAAVRDPEDPSSVNAELDPTLVLDILDALPSAVSFAAGGVAATLVNARVARRDLVLEQASSLSREMRARLRAAPLHGSALFGPEVKEALQTRQQQQPALSSAEWADTLAQSMAKHFAPPKTTAPKVRITNRSRRRGSDNQQKSDSTPPATQTPPRGRGRGRGRGGRGRGRGQFPKFQGN
jgi:hypothetical protein